MIARAAFSIVCSRPEWTMSFSEAPAIRFKNSSLGCWKNKKKHTIVSKKTLIYLQLEFFRPRKGEKLVLEIKI